MAIIDQILTDALAKASNIDRIDSYAGSAFAFSGSRADTGPFTDLTAPVVVEPAHESFKADPALWVTASTSSQQFMDWLFQGSGPLDKLATLVANYLSSHFPNDAYDTGLSWINSAISGGVTGIPSNVEAQIWNRGRDRVNIDNQRALNDTTAEFAARGMPLPPGALVAQLQALRLDGLQKNADVSRDTAIKAVDVQIEFIKLAVQEAMKMRYQAMQAATDYIRALVSISGTALQSSHSMANIQADLINASANFFNARTRVAELQVNAAQATSGFRLKQEELLIEQLKAQIAGTVSGAVGGASAMADAVSAALSAMNAIAINSTQL